MKALCVALLLAASCFARIHDSTNIELGALKLKVPAPVPSGGVKLRLRDTFFEDIAAYILPDIVKAASKITIPGMKTAHFSFSSFQLQGFDIESLNILLPNGDIEIGLNGLSLTVPKTAFELDAKVMGLNISCTGSFWGSTIGTNGSITTGLITNATSEKMQFVNAQSNISFGVLNVDHKLDSFLCQVGEDIIELLVGSLNQVIIKVIKEKLPVLLKSIIMTKGNEILQKFPLPIVAGPNIDNGFISVTAMLLPISPPQSLVDNAIGVKMTKPLKLGAFPARDIEFFIPASTIDDVLILVSALGIFNRNVTLKYNTSVIKTLLPAAYNLCPNCPLNIDLDMPSPPNVQFGSDSTSLTLTNTQIGLNVVNKSNQIEALVVLSVNATVSLLNMSVTGVNQSTVFFQLGVPQPIDIGLVTSNVGPVDTSLLNLLLGIALNILVPDFNQKFKGITLPAIHGFYFQDLVVQPTPGQYNGALNIVFPPHA